MSRFARLAGFQGSAINQAVVVSYAATRWDDAYTWDPPGAPVLDQWGLFATFPATSELPNPRDLYDPQCSAADAYRWYRANDGTWDWHPVVQAHQGALIRGAYDTIERLGLWSRKAKQMGGPAVPLGHPVGTIPALPFGSQL